MEENKILVAKDLRDGWDKSINDYEAVFILESDEETTKKLIEKWVGNAHLRVIPKENQEEALKAEIDFFLGIPEPVEIERKYLIEYPDLDMLTKLSCCKKVEISQSYLRFGDDDKIRVRRRAVDKDVVYIKTYKKRITKVKHTEIEAYISGEEYEKMISEEDSLICSISKDRYCFVYKNQYFELDVFPFWKDKAMMEIELKSEDEKIELPDFVKVIREVTEDKSFTNFALAKSHA